MEPFVWETHEYLHTPKKSDWFWALGIVAAACIFISVLLGNILFAIFIALSAFALALYAARKPKTMRVEINSKGIRVNSTVFPFAHIQGFALSTDARSPSLVLTMQKLLMPHILIPLGEINPEDVRTILAPRLPEEHYEEPMFVKIFEAFGL
jgi:hypothetical protein